MKNLKILRLIFSAFFAVERCAQFFAPSFFVQNPFARNERRFVANMLKMSAFERCSPIIFAVCVKTDYLSFHYFAGSLCIIFRREAGFHQRKIESAIAQQTPDEITSGKSFAKCPASAASTVADRTQSCAIFIITSITSRACQTAVRPRSCGLRPP